MSCGSIRQFISRMVEDYPVVGKGALLGLRTSLSDRCICRESSNSRGKTALRGVAQSALLRKVVVDEVRKLELVDTTVGHALGDEVIDFIGAAEV